MKNPFKTFSDIFFYNFKSDTYNFFAKTRRPLWYGYALWISSIFIEIISKPLGDLTLYLGFFLILTHFMMKEFDQHSEKLKWELRFQYIKNPLEHLKLNLFDFDKLEKYDLFDKNRDKSKEAKLGYCNTNNVIKARLGLELINEILNIDVEKVGPDLGNHILTKFLELHKNSTLFDKNNNVINSSDLEKTFGKIFKK